MSVNQETQVNDTMNVSVPMVSLRMVREKTLKYKAKSVTGPLDILELVKPIFKNSYREVVVIVGLDVKNNPTGVHIISYGAVNQSAVFISSVAKFLLLNNSMSGILCHNHPTSNLTPSNSDKEVTRKLSEALRMLELDLTDHIIVNADCSDYNSLREFIPARMILD